MPTVDYGRPSYLSDNVYVVKTKVKFYVKLHFVRSLNLPNLEQIREIESEYNSLSFPNSPNFLWPVGILAFSIILFANARESSEALAALFIAALSGIWLKIALDKRKFNTEIVQKSTKRAGELHEDVAALF